MTSPTRPRQGQETRQRCCEVLFSCAAKFCVLSERVQQVAEHSQAQTSRVAVAVAQQLEKEIEAAATSTATTTEIQTHTAVEGMRRDVQAHIEQTVRTPSAGMKKTKRRYCKLQLAWRN